MVNTEDSVSPSVPWLLRRPGLHPLLDLWLVVDPLVMFGQKGGDIPKVKVGQSGHEASLLLEGSGQADVSPRKLIN